MHTKQMKVCSYFIHTDLYNIFLLKHGENVFDFSLLTVFSDSWSDKKSQIPLWKNFTVKNQNTTSWENSKICWSWLS